MMGTKKTARLFAVAGVAALALSACGTTGGNNSSDDAGGSSSGKCDYKIGYLGAETGPNGNLGTNMVGGIKTALAAYNAAHTDCQVTLEDQDSQGDASQATSLATKLIGDKTVLGVVGPGFSGESEATGPAFAQAGLVTVSPSATDPTLTTHGWATFHRVVANDAAQGPAAAKYLTETAGAKKVFVVDDSESYGTGLADAVAKALGSAVVERDSFENTKIADVLSGLVTKIKGSGADAVFVGGYYADSGLLAKALRQGGWKGIFSSGDGSEDPGFLKAAGKEGAEGAVLTAAAAPASADFVKQFAAANNGAKVGLYSTEAFDAANVLLDGIAGGATTREDLLKAVTAYDKDGVTKHIKFTPEGEVTEQAIYAYVVKNGEIQPGTPIQ